MKCAVSPYLSGLLPRVLCTQYTPIIVIIIIIIIIIKITMIMISIALSFSSIANTLRYIELGASLFSQNSAGKRQKSESEPCVRRATWDFWMGGVWVWALMLVFLPCKCASTTTMQMYQYHQMYQHQRHANVQGC